MLRRIYNCTGSAIAAVCVTLVMAMLATAANAVVILQYHHISETTPRSTSTTPEMFAAHLEHIHKQGYAIVPLENIVALLKDGKPLPDKTAVITFDDGYESVYSQAFPLLKKYDYPFTVFVNTKPLGQQLSQFVTWQQLREMAQSGATIANHSLSHPHLLRKKDKETDQQWLDRISNEVMSAEKTIEKETQQQHKMFAYPYGEYNKAVQGLMKKLGFVSFGQQSGPVGEGVDLQAIPRFPFGGQYGAIEDFASKLASLAMPIEGVQVIDGQGKTIDDVILPSYESQPKLALQISDAKLAKNIACYASGQGAIQVTVTKQDKPVVTNIVFAHPKAELPVGRSRINCTAPSGEPGRFYWYSQLFIRKLANGEWYPEA
jgi:peptidoglycan/xylan/chitin deacetylase (PgdA/CDA1 family)